MNTTLTPAPSLTHFRASPGKFLVVALIDSDTYTVGDEQPTCEEALALIRKVTKDEIVPVEVYDDHGGRHLGNRRFRSRFES
jgi:hypothetical protein